MGKLVIAKVEGGTEDRSCETFAAMAGRRRRGTSEVWLKLAPGEVLADTLEERQRDRKPQKCGARCPFVPSCASELAEMRLATHLGPVLWSHRVG